MVKPQFPLKIKDNEAHFLFAMFTLNTYKFPILKITLAIWKQM